MFTDEYAYEQFSKLIIDKDRFGQSNSAREFLDEFSAQIPSRFVDVSQGQEFFRAANEFVEMVDDVGGVYDIAACGKDRMIPSAKYAVDGRINPKGVPVLYVATSVETAISEIRPWIDDIVSVVTAKLKRNCSLVDLSKRYDQYQHRLFQRSVARMRGEALTPNEINESVWSAIDHAFSQPVSRNDSAVEYAPTQILASIIREKGFDGVAYKSLFGGERGYNVAIFDTENVEIVYGQVYKIKSVQYTHSECGNPWFKSMKN